MPWCGVGAVSTCFAVEQGTSCLGNGHSLIASGTDNHSQRPPEVVVQAFATTIELDQGQQVPCAPGGSNAFPDKS
jgi:hypothetical protein